MGGCCSTTNKDPGLPPTMFPRGFTQVSPQPHPLGAAPSSTERGWVGSWRLWLSVSRELVKTEREKINSGVNESREMIWADPRNPLL